MTAPAEPVAVPAPAGGHGSAGGARRLPTWLLPAAAVASLAWLLERAWQPTWHHVQLDFQVYVLGAHHLVDGRLYQVSLPEAPYLPFTYPPLAAVGFAPLAPLPFSAAALVWAAVNAAALVAVCYLSLRAVLPGRPRRTLVLGACALAGPATLLEPVSLTFFFGQVNLVLAALVLADLTMTVRLGRRALPRGVLVGVACAVKLVPLVFVPYLFLTRQVRAAWTALAAFAGLTLVAAALDPAQSWSYWTRFATDARRVGDPAFISNQSLRGALDRLAHQHLSTVVTSAAAGVVLVGGLALARWAWRDSSAFLGLLVAATTGLLASPISWAHHFVWAVPVLVWLLWGPDRPAGGRLWAGAASVVLWWAPLWHVPNGHDVELHEHGWQLLLGNSFTLLCVVFLAGVAVLLTVRRRGPAAGRPGAAVTAPAVTAPADRATSAGGATY